MIISLIFGVFWLLALAFNKIGVESKILKDMHKIIMHVARAIFICVFGSFILVFLAGKYTGDSIDNYPMEEIISLFILGFLVSLTIYIPIILTFSSLFIKKYFVYFEIKCPKNNKVFEKLYIIKLFDKDNILLSDSPSLFSSSIQIIKEREFLNDHVVYTESTNEIKVLINNWKNKKNRKKKKKI